MDKFELTSADIAASCEQHDKGDLMACQWCLDVLLKILDLQLRCCEQSLQLTNLFGEALVLLSCVLHIASMIY